MIQEASSQPGLPRLRDISADTIKMPEPIMDPATSMVESNNPRLRASSLFAACIGIAELNGLRWLHGRFCPV